MQGAGGCKAAAAPPAWQAAEVHEQGGRLRAFGWCRATPEVLLRLFRREKAACRPDPWGGPAAPCKPGCNTAVIRTHSRALFSSKERRSDRVRIQRFRAVAFCSCAPSCAEASQTARKCPATIGAAAARTLPAAATRRRHSRRSPLFLAVLAAAMAPRRPPASEKAMESIDPRTRFLYTPHTVTFLLLGAPPRVLHCSTL